MGHTPLVKLNRLSAGLDSTIVVKLEARNPLGSRQGRIAVAMIEAAEKDGSLARGRRSGADRGNTVRLAFVCAARAPAHLTDARDPVIERRKLLQALGAEFGLTPGSEGMTGAVRRAEGWWRRNDYFMRSSSRIREPGDPPCHHGGRDLAGHRRRCRRAGLSVGTGGRRSPDRRGAQGAQAGIQGDRRRAGALAGPVGRQAGPAQDPGHRRRLRPEVLASLRDRRDYPGERETQRRPRGGWHAKRGSSRVSPRAQRRSRRCRSPLAPRVRAS